MFLCFETIKKKATFSATRINTALQRSYQNFRSKIFFKKTLFNANISHKILNKIH